MLVLLRPKGDFEASDQQVPTWLHESIADPSDITCVAGTAAHASPGANCSPQPLSTFFLFQLHPLTEAWHLPGSFRDLDVITAQIY